MMILRLLPEGSKPPCNIHPNYFIKAASLVPLHPSNITEGT